MRRMVWIALAVMVMIAGCGRQEDPLLYAGRMKYAGRTIDHGIASGYIWIDTDTGVCYLESNTGVFTVMVDRDGKPYIANGWRDYGGEE